MHMPLGRVSSAVSRDWVRCGVWVDWGLTRDSGADYHDRGGGVGFVAHGDFGPWFGAAHVGY